MSATLLLSLIGIALLDSLNPSLFLAQFYLLTTPRPVPRLLAYIAGVLLVNFGGGVLVLGGLRTLVANLLSALSGDALNGLLLVLGLAILAFGLWLRAHPTGGGEAKKPRSLRPVHAFALGTVVMLNEITTALPYFVAIERIAQGRLGAVTSLLALVLYNAVFALPLLGFLGLFVAYRRRFAAHLQRINRAIQVWMPRAIAYASILFGAALALNAAAYLLTGTPLFG